MNYYEPVDLLKKVQETNINWSINTILATYIVGCPGVVLLGGLVPGYPW